MERKKILVLFLLLCILIAGCSREEIYALDQAENYSMSRGKDIQDAIKNAKEEIKKGAAETYEAKEQDDYAKSPDPDIEKDSVRPEEGNQYFFNQDHVYLKANAEYIDGIEYVETVVSAEIYLVKKYENGNVYKFKVEPLGELTEDRLNTYFYVTNDKIYRLWSSIQKDKELITFYDNDELLAEVLDTDEKLVNNGEIVCQDEEVESELEEDETGHHVFIQKWENQIVYSSWNIRANGELDYYENFRWEEGKGLIEFDSGYRAERDILYLSEITETEDLNF